MSDLNFANNETDLITILIVEQDAQLLSMLEVLFSAGGYEVFCAENGRAALEQAEKFRYPLVITALDLPDIEAVEMLVGLTEIDPFIECILLAQISQLSRVIEASEVGNVYNHFWKPLQDMGELVRTVARALERRELRLNNAHLLTELRDSREEERKLFRHLEQLDKASGLGQLTQNLNGNIEIPLERLLSYGHYMKARLERNESDPVSAEQMNRALEYLAEMEKSVQNGYEVLQHIINYAANQDDGPSTIKIEDVLNESIDLVRPLLDSKSISVSIELATGTPDVILNRTRLRQILVGILLNAQQALEDREGNISISTGIKEKAAKQEKFALICIKDNGCGISEEVLSHVFDPFFSTRRREDNLGIGLTIARRILHDWDGDIEIDSSGSNGTQVTIVLPVRTTDELWPKCESSFHGSSQSLIEPDKFAA